MSAITLGRFTVTEPELHAHKSSFELSLVQSLPKTETFPSTAPIPRAKDQERARFVQGSLTLSYPESTAVGLLVPVFDEPNTTKIDMLNCPRRLTRKAVLVEPLKPTLYRSPKFIQRAIAMMINYDRGLDLFEVRRMKCVSKGDHSEVERMLRRAVQKARSTPIELDESCVINMSKITSMTTFEVGFDMIFLKVQRIVTSGDHRAIESTLAKAIRSTQILGTETVIQPEVSKRSPKRHSASSKDNVRNGCATQQTLALARLNCYTPRIF